MSNFTIIHHDLRLKMGLSCNEYCVGDLIRRLSENTNNGWCFASRSKIGEMMGLTKPTIITILNILVSLKLVEVESRTKDLRVTELWLSFFTDGKDSLPTIGQDSLPKRERFYKKSINEIGKESLPHRKDSLPIGQDSLPQIGQDSLPPSYKEISLEEQLKVQLEIHNPSVEKNDGCFTVEEVDFEIQESKVDSEEKKEETPSKVARKVSPKKPKEESPEVVERKRLHEAMKSDFKKKFPGYYWSAKDGSAVNELIKKIRFSFSEKYKRDPSFQDSLYSFNFLINHLPEFYLNNLDLKVIEAKYNAVTTLIKEKEANGKSTNNNSTNKAGVGSDHHKSVVELLIEDHRRNEC